MYSETHVDFVSTHLASEQYNNTAYTRSAKQQYFRRASQQTKQRNRLEQSYTSRKNICSECNTALSRSNTCAC